MAVCFCASHSSALFSSFYVPLPCRVLWIFHFFLLLEETVLSPPHLAQCGFNLSIIFPLFFTSVPLLCVSSPGYTSISLGFLPVCFCLSVSIGRPTYNYTYIYHSPLIALSWSHFIFCSSLSSTSLWFSFFIIPKVLCNNFFTIIFPSLLHSVAAGPLISLSVPVHSCSAFFFSNWSYRHLLFSFTTFPSYPLYFIIFLCVLHFRLPFSSNLSFLSCLSLPLPALSPTLLFF